MVSSLAAKQPIYRTVVAGSWKVYIIFSIIVNKMLRSVRGKLFKKQILLIRDMVVERCNRLFGCQTIHSTQKLTSMNLLQMSCVRTWAWSFLTSEVVEAVRGQKLHFLANTLALLLNARLSHVRCQFYQEMRSSLHLASISRILEPSPQGLISSNNTKDSTYLQFPLR